MSKQAKILTPKQEAAVLRHLETTRYPTRDRVTFLLSIKAGLRAKEIAALTWSMVTGATGEIASAISLPDSATKGRSGRIVPMAPTLRDALVALKDADAVNGRNRSLTSRVVFSERGEGFSANSMAVWFHRLYRDLGYDGCSSHTGRRTFVTRAARKIIECGGTLRDVQLLAGHAGLGSTQSYIDHDAEAQLRVVTLI